MVFKMMLLFAQSENSLQSSINQPGFWRFLKAGFPRAPEFPSGASDPTGTPKHCKKRLGINGVKGPSTCHKTWRVQ